MNSEKISFTATIIQVEGMNAAYVDFPFSVEELFGTCGQIKVNVLFDGKARIAAVWPKWEEAAIHLDSLKKSGKNWENRLAIRLRLICKRSGNQRSDRS